MTYDFERKLKQLSQEEKPAHFRKQVRKDSEHEEINPAQFCNYHPVYFSPSIEED